MTKSRRHACWSTAALVAVAAWFAGCGGGFPCGPADAGVTCHGGQVCVAREAWTATYQCVTDPCGLRSLSCECAEPACNSGFFCGSVEENTVRCYCPLC